MEQAQADLPYKAFPTSAGVVERRYCTQSGLLAGAGSEHCRGLLPRR